MKTRNVMVGTLLAVAAMALATTSPARATADAMPLMSVTGAVATGHQHSCAVTAERTVKCWGDNLFGQLGTGDFDSSATARTVLDITNITQVVAGRDHTCALTTAGEVWCWGDNGWGQLGTNGFSTHTPVRLETLSSVVQLTARDFTTCALTSVGDLFCWGRNAEGELGVGDRVARYLPKAVLFPNGEQVAHVSAGARHTCAVDTEGELWCWGSGAGSRLGTFDFVRSVTPFKINSDAGTDKLVSVAAGWSATCTLNIAAQAYCFGTNPYGGLGDGQLSETAFPRLVVMPRGVTVRGPIDASEHFCFIGSDDKAYCFGRNDLRQAAAVDQLSVTWATAVNTSTPGNATRGDGVQALSVGANHSCAMLRSGSVTCWGANDAGQLGDGNSSPAQPPVRALDVVGAQQLPPQSPVQRAPVVNEPTPVQPSPVVEVPLTSPATDVSSSPSLLSEQSSTSQAGASVNTPAVAPQVVTPKAKVLRLRIGGFLAGREIARRVGFTYKGSRIASATMLVPKGQRACTTVAFALKGLRAGICKVVLLSVARNGSRFTMPVEVKVVKAASAR